MNRDFRNVIRPDIRHENDQADATALVKSHMARFMVAFAVCPNCVCGGGKREGREGEGAESGMVGCPVQVPLQHRITGNMCANRHLSYELRGRGGSFLIKKRLVVLT